eukprot:COSAG02_NODE_28944_length_579_cov_0.825000_1_plen_149_part_10
MRQQAVERLRQLKAEFADMKAPALRKELASRGLSTAGKKTMLLQRLAAHLEEEHDQQIDAAAMPSEPMAADADHTDQQSSSVDAGAADPDVGQFEQLKAKYSAMPKGNIKKHLKKRGLETKGSHEHVLERLLQAVRAEVESHKAEAMDA